MEIFHGGCHGCTMQEKVGIWICSECCYFDADWDLPSLNDSDAIETWRMNIIKDAVREKAKYMVKKNKIDLRFFK